jgi:hypothetical protein
MTKTQVQVAIDATHQIVHDQALAEEADAGFDAGEWSGPEHARILLDLLNQKAIELGFDSYDHLLNEAYRLNIQPTEWKVVI